MMDKIEQLIKLIENTNSLKRDQLFLPYAIGIVLEIDFKKVNETIITRWSQSGLIKIKHGAWGILEYIESLALPKEAVKVILFLLSLWRIKENESD